jgi:undecaprenyl-diphosphatase
MPLRAGSGGPFSMFAILSKETESAMDFFEAVVLGVVQGLTEFLPVSSSGHLVLFQKLFGIHEPVLAFDIAVHVGTLLAVVAYFSRDLLAIVKGVATYFGTCVSTRRFAMPDASAPQAQMAAVIVIGSIPTGIIGILFKDVAEELFSSVLLVGVSLCVTGILLLFTRVARPSQNSTSPPSALKAIVVGIAQGLAIVPGISRSGATIATALYLGLDRETAARFSFLLSIPAVAGAGLLGALDLVGGTAIPVPVMATGLVVSALVGYASLALLVWIVKRGRMHLFAPYCFIIGAAAIVFSLR